MGDSENSFIISSFLKQYWVKIMKKHACLSLLIGLLLFATTSKSQAESYLGDFCWQMSSNEIPVWIYKFGVYEKEGVNYALYGTGDDGQGGIGAAHGNAKTVGSNILMTIVGSGLDEVGGAWNETFTAVLSTSTLSGTWHNMGATHDNIGSAPVPYHTNGIVDPVACP